MPGPLLFSIHLLFSTIAPFPGQASLPSVFCVQFVLLATSVPHSACGMSPSEVLSATCGCARDVRGAVALLPIMGWRRHVLGFSGGQCLFVGWFSAHLEPIQFVLFSQQRCNSRQTTSKWKLLENKIRLIKDSPGFLCPPSPALGWYMSCTHVCATVRHKTGIWHLDSLIPHVPWPFSRNPTPSPLTFGGLQNRPRPPKGILPFRSTTAQTCLVSVPQHDEPRFPMELAIYRATVAGPQKTRV